MSWDGFHTGAAVLLTLLVLCVLLPWVWHRQSGKERFANNIALVRQRLEEIEREAREGIISEQDKKQAIDELKLSLADDENNRKPARQQRVSGLVVAAGALVALVAGGLTYYQVNQLDQVASARQAVAALPTLSQKLSNGQASDFSATDIQNLILAIRQRLQHEPDDAQGWMFLGRLLGSVNQTSQAVAALEKAYDLVPDNMSVVTTYIQLLMATDQRSQIVTAQNVLKARLSASPDNQQYALMLAVASAKIGDLATTEQYFEQVRRALPANSDIVTSLSARITQMKSDAAKVSQQPVVDNSSEPKSAAGTNESTTDNAVTVTVELSEQVTDNIPTHGYLIVFAQDARSQNKMPAAVVRQPLATFPVTVTLDESSAMLPAYTLSALSEARIIARISKDKDVMPSAGDWQGEITLSLGDKAHAKHKIVINKELQ